MEYGMRILGFRKIIKHVLGELHQNSDKHGILGIQES